MIAPPLVIEMTCFFKDQLDSVRCSPSLPRDMDALSRVNTRGVELYILVETLVAGSPTLEESYLSKKGGDPRTDQAQRGLTQNSRAGNPKRKRPNCHRKTPRSRGVGTLRDGRPADYFPLGTVGQWPPAAEQWWTVQEGGDPRTDQATKGADS